MNWRNEKGLTVIELLVFIIIVCVIAVIGYCNFKTSNADYKPEILKMAQAQWPNAKIQFMSSEFEDDDGDVEIDIMVSIPGQKPFIAEYDCTCQCFGGDAVQCRFDGIED